VVGGGGIRTTPYSTTLHNTIVAGNVRRTDTPIASDLVGAVSADSSHNLVGDAATAGGLSLANNNIIGQDPLLAPLGDYGGRTQTHALLTGSPAIDAGQNAFAVDADGMLLEFDQRGVGFPRIVHATVEIGAFEVQNQPPVLTTNTGITLDEGATEVIGNTELSVFDADQSGQTLIYTIRMNVTHGTLQLTGLGVLTLGGSFTQADIDAGALSYTHDGSEERPDSFVFSVSDGNGGTIGDTTFPITINPLNDPPVLDPIGNQSVATSETLAFTASASDADEPANTLTYNLDQASLALGMLIDPATGAFRWTPTASQPSGSYEVTVTVTDNGSPALSDAETFTIVMTVVWQNSRHPCDVGNNGVIDPLDVLMLINDINAHGSRNLTTASPPTLPPPPFLDPTGDGWISPLDVLTVINYINAHGSGPIPPASGGEGEYGGRIAVYGREPIAMLAGTARTGSLGFGTNCIALSAASCRGPHAAWPASWRPASRTMSKVARLPAVPDKLWDYDFETSELEEAISAIAGELSGVWKSQLRA
jgi:hypothetical protein